jgi:hypothetical protein
VILPDFHVDDLIIQGDRTWNIQLLHYLFEPSTIQCILSIHLSQTNILDKWTWAPASSGLFSVKSAHEVSSIFSGRTPLPTAAWHTLWGLKLQARLKHLFGRLLGIFYLHEQISDVL